MIEAELKKNGVFGVLQFGSSFFAPVIEIGPYLIELDVRKGCLIRTDVNIIVIIFQRGQFKLTRIVFQFLPAIFCFLFLFYSN